MLLAGSVLGLCVAAAPALGGGDVPPGGANVQIEETSASIDTFQALNSVDKLFSSKDRSDFTGFAESLHPAVLSGPEGTSDTFVSLAATMITPSSHAFPTGPLNGIGVSGRILDKAKKTTNPAPGVPVAASDGDFSANFFTSGPTPFLLAGSLNPQSSDDDDCTQIRVWLDGPLSREFWARRGGDCLPPVPGDTGFNVTDVLPAGDYELSVTYGTTVDAEDPGTSVRASAALEVNLQFFRRCTVTGNQRANRLNGTNGDDVICGSGGGDTINARGGNDLVFGGSGGDTINGGAGRDDLRGEGGGDRVRGNAGPDTLDGRGGADTLAGGADNDKIKARDDRRDNVRGGGGNRDVALVDRKDRVSGVERVRRR
ncbi:MAG: calcium-binding protein [Solirubrobacterales bacterium]